jgi:two-component system OmpR family sensor kinase
MGRLFWKIFFAFWLAQIVAGVGTGTVVWLQHQSADEREPHRHRDPFLQAAQAVLQHGGVDALRGLLREREREPLPPLYVVDESGRELLGREVSADAWQQAQQTLNMGGGRVGRVVVGDGHAYLLFIPDGVRPAGPSLLFPPPMRRGERPEDRPMPSPLFVPRDGQNTGRPPPPPDFLGAPAGGRPPPPPGGFPPAGPRGPAFPWMPPSPTALGLIGLTASVLFSLWLARYLSKPIRNLRTAFEALAEGKLGTRAEPLMGRRRDELADLGRDFDRMAERIAALVDAQRRLLHDVSHELRSPLARLQAAVGLARQQPDRMATTLERVEREAERLDRLVGELLALSRLEAGVPGGVEEDIDMGGLLADIVKNARFEAEAKNVRVECAWTEDLIVRGEAELLYRAVENVVRNAVQHAPEGSLVQVSGEYSKESRQLCLSVFDQGPGVAESQLEAIFEPFFHGNSRPGSVGLGLAIARRALSAHGGGIAAHNRPEGGLCVELILPVLPTGKPSAAGTY